MILSAVLLLALGGCPQEARELNDAAMKKVQAEAELVVKEKPLPEAAAELEKALGVRVVIDPAGVMRAPNKFVSFTLKRGRPAADAITEGLKPKRLTWTVWEGILFITNAAQKQVLDAGKVSSGPPDDEIRKLPEVWKRLNTELDLASSEKTATAMGKILSTSGCKLRGSWPLFNDQNLLGWSAKRSALRHLRVICRTTIATFKFFQDGEEIALTGDGVLFGPIAADVTLIGTIDNARTAAYTDNSRLYQELMKILKKQAATAREIIEEKLDVGKDDEKGTKILKNMLSELK